MKTVSFGEKLRSWLALSRLPFHSVGVLPYVLGSTLAWQQEAGFRWDVLLWGTAGVVLIMLATYYGGEYWDQEEDALSVRSAPSRFAGGSGVVQRGLVSPRAPLWASIGSLLSAAGVTAILQLHYHTGPWTTPLAVLGTLGGFFYSARPVRWVTRGWGEIWIAFCYGWLPVSTSYYLQTGAFAPLLNWISAPIGLSIFNVILLNEFPDYAADLAASKRNLTVRIGRRRAAYVHAAATIGAWLAMFLSARHGVPTRALRLYAPVMVLSAILSLLTLRGWWQERRILEFLCGANLVVNLGTTAVYIITYLT